MTALTQLVHLTRARHLLARAAAELRAADDPAHGGPLRLQRETVAVADAYGAVAVAADAAEVLTFDLEVAAFPDGGRLPPNPTPRQVKYARDLARGAAGVGLPAPRRCEGTRVDGVQCSGWALRWVADRARCAKHATAEEREANAAANEAHAEGRAVARDERAWA